MLVRFPISLKLLIVVEGADGTGKSTLVKKLVSNLKRNYHVFGLSFPFRRAEIISELKKYQNLKYPDKIRVLDKIERDFMKGLSVVPKDTEILILDRYVISTVVYQQSAPEITLDYLREKFYDKFIPRHIPVVTVFTFKRFRNNDDLWNESFLNNVVSERYFQEFTFFKNQYLSGFKNITTYALFSEYDYKAFLETYSNLSFA